MSEISPFAVAAPPPASVSCESGGINMSRLARRLAFVHAGLVCGFLAAVIAVPTDASASTTDSRDLVYVYQASDMIRPDGHHHLSASASALVPGSTPAQ